MELENIEMIMRGEDRADRMEGVIRDHPAFFVLSSIIWDDKIVRLFKGCLAMGTPRPDRVRFARLKMLLIPFAVFFTHLFRGGLAPLRKPSARVAIPCLWGVFKDETEQKIAGVRRFNDDMYLYGGHFRPGDILHIFGDWNIPPEGKRQWCEAMRSKGIPWADRKDFGVNLLLLRLTFRTAWNVLRAPRILDEGHAQSPTIWRAAHKGLYHYLLKYYEMENVDYKVEVVKNDYNPGHVAATIAANQAGRKRIGVSHVSSAVDSPQICFVHFDKYATVCPMQEKWHGRFWDDLPLARVGKESIDSAVEAAGRREDIRWRLARKNGPSKWNVLVLFPGNADRCLLPQWERMYKGLSEWSMTTEIDANVYLRFRRLTEALEVPHMARLAGLVEFDKRFFLEHDEFTTHELMAASDLVITANASFAINEAMVIGKPVFTFDYTLKAKRYFDEPGFILTDPDDVIRVLNGLGEPSWPEGAPDWNRMRADADYHFDGRNRERLAVEVAGMLA